MISRAKAKIIAHNYVNNGFNMSETIRELHPELKNPAKIKHLGVKAVRALASVRVKQEIEEIMNEKGIDDGYLLEHHKYIIEQNEHLPSKNTAIDMAYKLRGSYAPEKKQTASLNVDVSLKDLKKELEELDEFN